MKAKVSIIVPIYNVEPYFKQCINSIRNQTMKEIEIILIDDGSTDHSPQMCDQFAAEDERILVVHQENAGVSAARNCGMKLASADWIMFVDPDDWLEENAVEILYNCAHQNDCDIVCAAVYRDYIDHQVLENIEACGTGTYFVQQSWEYILRRIIFPVWRYGEAILQTSWGKIYKKSCLQNNYCSFPVCLKKSEDRIFNLYAFYSAKKFYILDVPLYHYRYRSDSVSNTVYTNEQEIERQWCIEVRTFLETSLLWDKYYQYYNYTLIKYIFTFGWRSSLKIDKISTLFKESQQVKHLAEEKEFANAIQELPLSYFPDIKFKIKLCLLKCRMYWVELLIHLVKNQFKKVLNKRGSHDSNR